MRVRLVTKLANVVDGIDLSRWSVGDVIELPDRDARLLIAEGWAQRLDPAPKAREGRTLEQLRHVRRVLERQQLDFEQRRRAEDIIRDELQESRARTITAAALAGTAADTTAPPDAPDRTATAEPGTGVAPSPPDDDPQT